MERIHGSLRKLPGEDAALSVRDIPVMTRDQIDAILDRVRSWPPERQEDAANMLLAMEAEGTEPYELSEEERLDLEEGLREADRGEFATEEEVAAVFARFRR